LVMAISFLDVSLAKWLYLDGTVCKIYTQWSATQLYIGMPRVHQKILSTNCSEEDSDNK